MIYWGCEDTKKEDNIPTEVTLWGVDYSIENTTELDLSNYYLTGSIPSEIGNLTNLRSLSLGLNELTGSIPPEIGNLTNLRSLYLFVNQLTGSIPSEIGSLTNLTGLDLSYNHLTGIIPESICDLFLTPQINNNKFCPPYPSCIEDYVGVQDTSNCGD